MFTESWYICIDKCLAKADSAVLHRWTERKVAGMSILISITRSIILHNWDITKLLALHRW